MRLLRAMASTLTMLLFAISLWSQTGTSTVRGTITDPQGRVVPNANVTLTNVETNAVRTTKSTDTGSYVFDLITPANYRLQVEATGFKKKVVDKVQALIGKPTQTDGQLAVGAVPEIAGGQSTSPQGFLNSTAT